MSTDQASRGSDIDLHAISPEQDPIPPRSAVPVRWPRLLSAALDSADYQLFNYHATSPSNAAYASLDLTTLQRLNLYHLQRRLAGLVREITSTKASTSEVLLATMDRVHECLKCYFEALRDLKLVREALKNADLRDVVVELTYLNSEQPGMVALLADAGLLRPADLQHSSSAPNLMKIPRNWDFHGTYLEDEKMQRRRKSEAFSQRLFMAAFGGAALVAPMLIMTLHPTKVTNLVTVSAFVVVVAVLLAYVMTEATPQDIIGATAAYAAVLVVFVGTSVPTH